LLCDGTDDQVTLPASSSILTNGDTSVSLCTWFKTADGGTPRLITLHRGSGSGTAISLGLSSGTVVGLWRRADDANRTTSSAASTYDDDEWHHACIVTDSAIPRVFLYVDDAAATFESQGYKGDHGTFAAKLCTFDAGNSHYSGLITNPTAYDKTLSSAQVLEMFNDKQKRIPYQIGATSFWPLDDCPNGTSGDGITFVDVIGGQDGTGVDGADNLVLTCTDETLLTYP